MTDDDWTTLVGSETVAPQGKHEDAVPHDRFDERSHAEALIESSGLRTQQNWATREFDYAGPFLQDLFYSLLKGAPQVREPAEMAATHLVNREMVAKFLESQDWQDLRQETAHHVITSALAMLSMDDTIRAALEAMQKARDLAEQAQQAQDAAEQAQQAQQEQEQGDQGDPQEGDGDQEGPGGTQEGGEGPSVQELLDAAAKARQRAQDGAEAAAAGMATRMKVAARKASSEIKEESELAAAFGMEDGQLKHMSFTERKTLMDRLRRNRLVKFVDLLGAMRAMAEAQWRKQVDGIPSQIAGVELSNELSRLVPQELMSLVVPALKPDFMRRYAERSLMTWQVKDNERLGKGPIVVVCDESGSMESRDVGGVTREAWSKALCLAIVDTARRQNRPVHYIGFSSVYQAVMIPEIEERFDLEATITMAEHFFDGGTYYETPLQMALGVAEHWHRAQQKTRADIVFISDDASRPIDEGFLQSWAATRAKLSIGCHGILIGAESSLAMRALCDTVRPITGVIAGGEVDAAAATIQALLP